MAVSKKVDLYYMVHHLERIASKTTFESRLTLLGFPGYGLILS